MSCNIARLQIKNNKKTSEAAQLGRKAGRDYGPYSYQVQTTSMHTVPTDVATFETANEPRYSRYQLVSDDHQFHPGASLEPSPKGVTLLWRCALDVWDALVLTKSPST